MEGGISTQAHSTELKTGLAFLTRLPVATAAPAVGGDIARASWTFPIIGAGIGVAGALVYWIAHGLDLPAFVSAVLAVASTLLLTGGLHEDGLADTADGFGGGTSPERKLEIMRDGAIGTYGATALFVSLLLRVGAIASLADPGLVALALIASHAGARATMPLFMGRVPRARPDGLSAEAGPPPERSSAIALGIGLFILLLCLGFGATLIAAVLLAGAFFLVASIAVRQIGGQTGDVLGMLEQISEILILLVAAARLQA
jgi:adenosylcobinamide-GDP ribazoletransferase